MTELDLRHSLVPNELIEELTRSMPEHVEHGQGQYDYVKFMESLIDVPDGANGV